MPQRDERGRFVAADFGGSPGGPDGGMGKFTTELQEATKSLGTFDKVTEQTTKTVTRSGRAAGGGGAGRGFAMNTAAKIGRQTVRAAGFDLAGFAVTQGANLASQGLSASAGFSFFKSIAQNPTMAKALDLDLTLSPIARAGQRTLGITGAMARLGADPSEIAPIREQLLQQFGGEEMRAAKEARAVELRERAMGGDAAAAGAKAALKNKAAAAVSAVLDLPVLKELTESIKALNDTLRLGR